MGCDFYTFPRFGTALSPCLCTQGSGTGIGALRRGKCPHDASSFLSARLSGIQFKYQSNIPQRPSSRGSRHQQSSSFNLSTGMSYAQFKEIKRRRRPIWPWIIFAVLLIMLLSRIFPDNSAVPASAPSSSLLVDAAPTITATQTVVPTPTMPPRTSTPRFVTPSPTPAPTATPVTALGRGMRGDEVRALQNKLIELGYLPKGEADGVFGRATEKAVEAFQEKNKLYADGVAGEKTLTLLYSGNAKKK